MNGRQQQKARTRQALLDAALSQLGPDRGFASLSLREVARAAGIAPTSFYRHFRDLEELGLVLVEEAGDTLRKLMRQARHRVNGDTGVLRASVSTFMEYVVQHEGLFHVLLRERAVGSVAYRLAVKNVIRGFVHDLADDIERENRERRIAVGDIRLLAETIVSLVLEAGANAMENPEGAPGAITEKLVAQLRMVVLGAQRMAELGKP